MSDLPDGWIAVRIGDITSDSLQRQPSHNEKFKYIDMSSVDRDAKCIVNPQILLGSEAPSRARKIVSTGDVLVAMTRPNLNAVAIINIELDQQIASTGFDVLRPVFVVPKYLFYIVRSENFVVAMSDLVQGALYPAVRSKDVRNYTMPLAPINEQQRIADKLDILLAQVDACRERLEHVIALIKRFRKAILVAATSGRLINQTDISAVQRKLNLADIIEYVKTGPFGSTLHKSDYVPGGIPVINPMHINAGIITPSYNMAVSESGSTTLNGDECGGLFCC